MKHAASALLWACALAIAAPRAGAAELGESPFAAAPKARGAAAALAVADADFAARLPPADERASEMTRFAADPDNYRIAIDREGDRYVIEYSIKPFDGAGFRGGGYRYAIDAYSYRILERRAEP